MDFRGLNALTKEDTYPLPGIDDIMDTLNNMNYFTTLDQANAYWSIPITEKDKEKTAFLTPIGLYEFNYLPFSLCNPPSTFQRLTDLILAGLQWTSLLIYFFSD